MTITKEEPVRFLIASVLCFVCLSPAWAFRTPLRSALRDVRQGRIARVQAVQMSRQSINATSVTVVEFVGPSSAPPVQPAK